jgi:hypothetical protein
LTEQVNKTIIITENCIEMITIKSHCNCLIVKFIPIVNLDEDIFVKAEGNLKGIHVIELGNQPKCIINM